MHPSDHPPKSSPWASLIGLGALHGMWISAVYALLYGVVGAGLMARQGAIAASPLNVLYYSLGLAGVALPTALVVGGFGGMITAPMLFLVLRRFPNLPRSKVWLVGLGSSLALFLLLVTPVVILLISDSNPALALRDTLGVLSQFLLFP